PPGRQARGPDDRTQATPHPRPDPRDPAGTHRHGDREGRDPPARHLARHPVPLEAEVRRRRSGRSPSPPGARGGEPASQAGGRRPGGEPASAQGRPGKRLVTAAQRRAVVADARAHHPLSERQACRYLGLPRTPIRYRPRRAPPVALVARLRELAAQKVRWGSPRLTWLLRREGWLVNHKRIERLLREERLLVPQRRGRKRAAVARVPAPVPTRADERWSMDFVRDTLVDGRPFRIWAVVDDATRECPFLLVARSLPAGRVVDALETLRLARGLPATLVCDNGPEFVSQALDQWATDRGVRLDFIR